MNSLRLYQGPRQRRGLVVTRRWASELIADLLAARLDVGLGHALTRARNLRYTTLAHEPLHALVTPAHPLAAHTDAVPLTLFAQSTLVSWRALSPGVHEHARSACRTAGFEPRVRPASFLAPPDLADVAAELGSDGFFLAPHARPLPEGTIAVALTDPPRLPLTVVTNATPMASVRGTVAVLVEVTASLAE